MAEAAVHVPDLSAGDTDQVEAAVGSLSGVEWARADLLGKRVVVGYDETAVSVADITAAVRSTGHTVESVASPPQTVRDPVCGMELDPHTAEHWSTYRGRTYAFCTLVCKTSFEARPAKYAATIG